MYFLMSNIYMTGRCNRQCPECYYPKTNADMTYRMAHDISIWLASIYSKEEVKLYKIHFLGGEPLLNVGKVHFLIDRINIFKPDFTEGHPDGRYVLFTNGDFATPNVLKGLKKRDVKIMLNPTTATLKEVEQKITTIKNSMGGCSLSIVLDAYNIERLEDLTKLALKYHCHMRINRLYAGGRDPEYIQRYKEGMHKVFDLLLKSEWVMWPNFIMESTYPLWKRPENPNACGKNFIAIDPDGSIRSCNGDCSTNIGHINTHSKMSDFTFSHRWTAKNFLECQECEYVTFCQAGCPFVRKLAYSTYNKKTPFCDAFKELFPELLLLRDKWREQHGMG